MAKQSEPPGPPDRPRPDAPLAAGTTVVVTGAGTGIGRATARAFRAQGAQVLLVGRTRRTLEETRAGDDGMQPLTVDLTEPDGPARVVDVALDEFGRIDVLVNNAGVGGFETIEHIDRSEVDRQFGVNLVAPIILLRHALPSLQRTGGVVVNVGTAATFGGLRSTPVGPLYGASKAALDYLTRAWALELAPRGVRVVGVAPGVIDTGIGMRMGMSEGDYRRFLVEMGERVPAGRVGRPDEVAWWITRLARADGAYLNGTVLPVDGGLSLV